jgi:hypothetical protein
VSQGTLPRRSKGEVLLRIRAARIQEEHTVPKRGPLLMEQALAAMHSLERTERGVSLEIGSYEDRICFFARSDERTISLIEGQLYAQYPESDIERLDPAVLAPRTGEEIHTAFLTLHDPELFPIKRHPQFDDLINRITIDPLSSITATLVQYPVPGMRGHIAISFRPLSNRYRIRARKFLPLLRRGLPQRWLWYRNLFTRVHLARGWRRAALLPLDLLLGGFRSWFVIGVDDLMIPTIPAPDLRTSLPEDLRPASRSHDREDELQGAKDKVNRLLFETALRVSVTARREHAAMAKEKLQEILSSFKQFALPGSNHVVVEHQEVSSTPPDGLRGRTFLLSNEELATLWHLPTVLVKTPKIDWVTFRKLEPPTNLPLAGEADSTEPLTILGESVFRGRRRSFGIEQDDRRRHLYIIGKTGMGKSTLLLNMLSSDIEADRGVAIIDPHGDLAMNVLSLVPRSRTNDVVLFDPADAEFPLSFNMLECRIPAQRPLIASGLMAVFTKLWPDVWSGRMEHILRNTLLALLESPGSSSLGILRMYADDDFRAKVVSHLHDPMVRSFWEDEYASWSPQYRTEAVAAIQNKVGQILSIPLIRNIVGQVRSSLDLRHTMDTGKILIANLSKGRLGEDTANFLGSILVTKFQIDAMSRAEVPEAERRDFYLYVDEFQNFATASFATILSEARKYRLNLTLANQYIGQLTPDRTNTLLHDAVFGNVGTLVSFQVGSEDAEEIAKQFGDEMLLEDLLGLPKYHAYIRLMIEGLTSSPFSLSTLPPPAPLQDHRRLEMIRRLSRERYTKKRSVIEGKLQRWAASTKTARQKQKSDLKMKEKEEEERKKARKRGMSLEEYRKWRDREMWTNRFNQLKKKEGTEGLSAEEMKEFAEIQQKLAAAGGPTVEPTKQETTMGGKGGGEG